MMAAAGRMGGGRKPLEPGPPARLLGWVRGAKAEPVGHRLPVWLRVVLSVAVTLSLGVWGYLELHTHPRLDFLESLYAAVKLYTLDFGPANGALPGPDWQLWVALVLAAALVARGVLALGRERVRRATIRHRLRGHVVVCGAGVHGARLVQTLCDQHDVVLVDVDSTSPGMQELRGQYEWRLIGDCVTERTLLAAGAGSAHWLIAVTGNDFVNSQIVSAVRGLAATGRARDGIHVLVQVEDPALARFLEEESAGDSGTAGDLARDPATAPGAAAVVSPFSANAIAAEALLDESQVRLGHGDSFGPLVSMRQGRAPNLLLVGDHPLIDSLVLAALRRWRVRVLREFEAGSGLTRPPMHVSLYGPGAEQRVQRLQERWRPEPSVLSLEGRDSPPAREEIAATDLWLRRPDRADHAIVACNNELDGIALTLSVARALGNDARMTRVTAHFENALDAHVEERTARSANLATTEVKSVADLGAKPEQMSRLPGTQRLSDALTRGQDDPRAPALFADSQLGLRSDSGWRIRACERPLLEALLELPSPLTPVPLSALVRAGLRIELDSTRNLLTAARRLSARGHPSAFAAWCEYARRLAPDSPAPELEGLRQPSGDPAADRLLALRRATLGEPGALEDVPPGGAILSDAGRVAIFAGAAGSMSVAAQRQLEPILERALGGYPGIMLCGGTAVGVPGIVGRIAQRRRLRLVGYAPAGMGAGELYETLRQTPDATEFSVLEPLAMWTDILRTGVPASEVRLVVCPGGAITLEEILLARALGGQVAWLDPAGEAAQPLDDMLPLGGTDVLELPADAMTIRAFITPSRLPEPLREAVARYLHNDYRRAQRHRKASGDPALARWDELLPSLKTSNLAQADDIPSKLTLIGQRLAQPGAELELTDGQVELLAEVEHGRWNVERLAAGWKVGDRQVGRSTSPDLKPWAELADEVREFDREAVRNIAPALASAGWGVTDA